MAVHTDDFRGEAMEGIRFVDVGPNDGEQLYQNIKRGMNSELEHRGIPANIRESVVKSGGLFGSKFPLLMISHPSCRYFTIGIYVNGNVVKFPLLGESTQNTKANMKKMYEEQGRFIKAALVKPDMLKLEQEAAWRQSVLDCFHSLFED